MAIPTAALIWLMLAAGTPLPDCSGPAHRAFDFWLGDWEVYAGDRHVGRNRIEVALDGCGLFEHWRGDAGLVGRSINAYDRERSRWVQFWVDARGTTLQLEGGLQADGSMLLQTADGSQRIRWTPLEDGEVRQHWQRRKADGDGWETVFDGLSRRPQ